MNSMIVKIPVTGVSLELTSDGTSLCSASFVADASDQVNDKSGVFQENNPKNDPVLSSALKDLINYFQGSTEKPKTKLSPEGTEFQQKVWAALYSLPVGDCATYQDIARMIENPKSARGVGQAVGKNPLVIFIPCHRVLAKFGSKRALGGFSVREGLNGPLIKKSLLDLEQVVF